MSAALATVKNIHIQEDVMTYTFLATAGAIRVAVLPTVYLVGTR
jgi:hypothetical protein